MRMKTFASGIRLLSGGERLALNVKTIWELLCVSVNKEFLVRRVNCCRDVNHREEGRSWG